VKVCANRADETKKMSATGATRWKSRASIACPSIFWSWVDVSGAYVFYRNGCRLSGYAAKTCRRF
jgi:hypothetical protein